MAGQEDAAAQRECLVATLHGENGLQWRAADMGCSECAAIAEGGSANARGRRGEIAASVRGRRGEQPTRVGTGHDERAAIAGTTCGERTTSLRRASRRAATVADTASRGVAYMGCGERALPSRRAARRTCTAGLGSFWPAQRATWRAGSRRGHSTGRGERAPSRARDAVSVRGWCEGGHSEWGSQRSDDGSPSERSGATAWDFRVLREGVDGSKVQEYCSVASWDVVLCSALTRCSRSWTTCTGRVCRQAPRLA